MTGLDIDYARAFGDEPLLVIDAHADIPNPLELPHRKGSIDAGTPIALDLLKRGGVGALSIAGNVVRGPRTPEGIATDRAIIEAKLEAAREIAVHHPDKAGLALSAADVIRIAGSGRVAILLSVLGAHGLGDDLSGMEDLYRKGVRIFGMAHIGNTAFADSSRPFADEPANEHGGLSRLGRQGVELANRIGLALDVSQLSTGALLQTAALSKAPVIASHSAIRALVDTPRNLTDQELDAVAASGGVVAIVAFSSYLRPLSEAEIAARARIADQYGGLKNGYAGLSAEDRKAYYAAITAVTQQAGLDDYLKAINYAIDRIGVDHVALASDFNQGGGIEGWMRADETPNVTAALLRDGHSPAAVRKLWGGNILRVLRDVERVAVECQSQQGAS